MAKKVNTEAVEKVDTPVVSTFSKQQLVKSKLYERYSDFLGGVLSDGVQYTKDEVNKLIIKHYGVI